jgi:hypothetical protein
MTHYWAWLSIGTTCIQGLALWLMRRTLRAIVQATRALHAARTPNACTCDDEDAMSATGDIARRLSCPIHETNLTLGDWTYRQAPCPTCGQIIQPRSAP